MEKYIVKIQLLTPIWTGNENRQNNTLRETGIIGSLRWWYEALIRGLGGTACDPTDTKCNGKNHCDACELFGCTGWSRKFKLDLEKTNKQVFLNFIELREIKDEEWALLNRTIKIISNYGALGGRLAESKYGIIKIEEYSGLDKLTLKKEEIDNYLKKKGSSTSNPNLSRFIFINKNLNFELVKELKKDLAFLKGNKGKGKRYFYKISTVNRLFIYAENDEEYKQFKDFLDTKKIEYIECSKLLEGLK